MTRWLVRLALIALFVVPAMACAAPALESTRTLTAGLARTGRAEAMLSWSVAAPTGGGTRSLQGSLALEPPDRARLDVRGTGERITLRADGGEWLQPRQGQMVRLTPRHSVAALRWWRLLASGSGATERRLGTRRWRLTMLASGGLDADSCDVQLDARGLPSRLELPDGMGGRQVYTLAAWRFSKPKGDSAFRLTPPAGVEVVEMP